MSLRATLFGVHKIFADNSISHALIGGMGLAALGIHRATNDVDFLIREDQTVLIRKCLEAAGWTLIRSSEEVMHWSGLGQLDLLIARRPLSLQMLSEAKVLGTIEIPVVSPEGIIGLKIQAYTNDRTRELQDKADIQKVIRKFPSLDWGKIRNYADLFGEWSAIEKLRGNS